MAASKRKGQAPRGPIASAIATELDALPSLTRPRTGRSRTRKGGTVRRVSVRSKDGAVTGAVYVLDASPPDITVRLSNESGRYSTTDGAVAAVRRAVKRGQRG